MPAAKRLGTCEGCNASSVSLKQIDSGQWICRSCLRQLHPPRPKGMAKWADIKRARQWGFDVGEELTEDRLRVLKLIHEARERGLSVSDNASEAAVIKAMSRRPETIDLSVWDFSARYPDDEDSEDDFDYDPPKPIRLTPFQGVRLELNPTKRFPKQVLVSTKGGRPMGVLCNWGNQRFDKEYIADYLKVGGQYRATFESLVDGRRQQGYLITITFYPHLPQISERIERLTRRGVKKVSG